MRFDEVPMLSGGSLIGHLSAVRNHPLDVLRKACEECGDLIRMRGIPGHVIGIVRGTAHLHDVLVAKAKSFEKSPVLRSTLEPLAGLGLFTSEGELWRSQRKLMAPMFQHRELERYAEAMRTVAERAAGEWRDGETFDVARQTTRITMAVAGRTLFDADTFGDADDIGAAITTVLGWIEKAASSPLTLLQMGLRTSLLVNKDSLPSPLRARADQWLEALLHPTVLPDTPSRKMREAIRFLDERVARMIADRRAAGLDRHDLLTRLLVARDEGGARMSDKQVRDEILTLFIAGHETTASGLAWTFYFIARDPELRRRLLAEVDALEGRPIGVAELPRLPLSLAVFKEALRIYPPIYVFGRQAIEDVDVAGCRVDKGTILLISPFMIHRSAADWPDPERFDPSRFTPEAEAARPKMAYLPFSAGPRTCIGNHFALMEGPIVLATLLQRAELDLTSSAPAELEPSATLRPKGGIPMKVRLR